MKKFLLSTMVLFAAMAVNAQTTEFGNLDESVTEEWEGSTYLPGGTVLHAGDIVTWSTATGDNWTAGGATATYVINSESCASAGLAGSTNPKYNGNNLKESNDALPDSGAVNNFAVKQAGYLYILAKLNTSKNYIVWEDGNRIPYLWVASDDTGNETDSIIPSYTTISFDLSEQTDIITDGYITSGATVQKPNYYLYAAGQVSESYAVDCQAGIIKIAVKAGSTYTFCGTGTKVLVGGYYFDTTGDATITYTDANDNEYTLLKNGQIPTEDEEGDEGDEAEGSITLPNNDLISCTFASNDEGKYATDTDNFTFATSEDNIGAATNDDGSLKYGSVTIGDTEYTIYYKLTSTASITFATTEDNTELTLVFGPTDDMTGSKYIYITDPSDSKNKINITTQLFTYTCETAGTYTVAKGSGEYHVFYIGLDKYTTTGISNAIISSNEGNGAIYNLAGQRLNKLTKGINIVNGKKILVK